MHCARLISLLAFTAGACAAVTETHDGIDFEVRWTNTSAPENTPVKDAYESAAAQQATKRLQTVIKEKGIATQCLSANQGGSPAELYAFKDCILGEGATVFFDLLSQDIEEANDFWDNVVAKSTSDRKQWVAARTYVRAFYGHDLSALNFAAWTTSANADKANSNANPEHYYKATQVTGLDSQSSQIFEGWGGVLSSFGTQRTNFTVPRYATPKFGTPEYPNEWNISPKFSSLFQRIGPKVLATGSKQTFGVLHIAVRDVPKSESGAKKDAIEVYAAVWYPPYDGADEHDKNEFQKKFVSDEAHHMVVEIINLTLKAKKDCFLGLVTCLL